MKSMNILLPLTILSIALSNFIIPPAKAQLLISFYRKTCPNVTDIVRASITPAITAEPRMAASLLRLFFHDCFVQGCDGSILLDDTATIQSEKNAAPNVNSARGYGEIEAAKLAVENVCPGIVSCADILALAAREAVTLVGGPHWDVRLGRMDSTTANLPEANNDLPGPSNSLPELTAAFAKKGLTVTNLVALSGAHTIGRARCLFFRTRIYNDTDIDPAFATVRRGTCPLTGGDNILAPFDPVTPDLFDNSYYVNLVAQRGLLHSDQTLTSGTTTNKTVIRFSNNQTDFANEFAKAMFSMSLISPILRPNGIIRNKCSAIN